MAQRPIEIILMRQLASYLAMPILLVNRDLDLLFFNEPAEPILGRRFEETGPIGRGEWSRLLRPADANGIPIPRDEQPLAVAVDRNEPSHRRLWLTGLDGVARVIEGLAFPLETEDGLIGAAGIFWEVRDDAEARPKPTPSPLPCSRYDVEVILLRRLADRLLMPTYVIDADGRLLFYNPPAEPLIGRPNEQYQHREMDEAYNDFRPCDEDGSPIKREDHPLYVALREQQPTFRRFYYQGLDGVKRHVAGTSFPLIGQCNRHLGAVGLFWEDPR